MSASTASDREQEPSPLQDSDAQRATSEEANKVPTQDREDDDRKSADDSSADVAERRGSAGS